MPGIFLILPSKHNIFSITEVSKWEEPCLFHFNIASAIGLFERAARPLALTGSCFHVCAVAIPPAQRTVGWTEDRPMLSTRCVEPGTEKQA